MADRDRYPSHDAAFDYADDTPTPARQVSPGKRTLTSHLPAPPFVFRVADPATATALGAALRGRDDNGVAAGADQAIAAAQAAAGSALPNQVQRQFEESLGADLSHVRIHTDSSSVQAANELGARAYTVGSDIHFNAGQYDPTSATGQHLLAHEVAHTVQQSTSRSARPQTKLAVSNPSDSAEIDADRAADAMVRHERVEVSAAQRSVQREPGPVDSVPPPPGVQILKNFGPVAAAVAAGEAGGNAKIPAPTGLLDVAVNNYNNFANHCTNIQAHYHAKAGAVSVPLIGEVGGNHFFAEFATTAGLANAYCEGGAVAAGAAQSTISSWIGLLQSSQDAWSAAKQAADELHIDTVQNPKGGTALDSEGVQDEGQQAKGLTWLVTPKEVPDTPEDATPQQKADLERRRRSSDEDSDSGKNIAATAKTTLDNATTDFEQSVTAMTTARSAVVTARGRAMPSFLSAKSTANAKRQKASEDEKGKIDEILGLIDTLQGAIEKGQGIVAGADDLKLLSDTGDEAMKIKASQVAKLILQLDGTLPAIEGEIAACKTRGDNLKSIMDTSQVAANAKAYTDALAQFRTALNILPERISKYEKAHKAFAEVVNTALRKRGVIKPGDAGVKPQLKLLAKLRIASAAAASASGATADVQGQMETLTSMGPPPSPDVCQLAKMVAAHKAAFGSAPGHIASIQGVLTNRETQLKDYVSKMEV